ncbi:MAG: DegQ family serine endoprotease [Acidobacteria bacterium]|nr:DegQ family serine endoprotease [Acidobacteriota bacterium]
MRKINEIGNFRKSVKINSFTMIFIGCLAAFICLALTVGFFLPHIAYGQIEPSKDSLATTKNPRESSRPIGDPHNVAVSYADIVERVSPAVVTIRADILEKSSAQDLQPFLNDPMFREFFRDRIPQGKPQPRMEHALGSGVIVKSDGTILTNNHVVAGAQKIQVEFPDRKTYNAKVVGTDPLSDLAVLKIDAKDLPVLKLGNSDMVRVGDVVLAIGNPLGLRQTVTSGIISAKGRQTGISDGTFEDFLQTDAPINHGNSGGALVDLNGDLIGINSQILSPSGGNIGIGFAIPSNMAKTVMDQLIKNGKVHRGMLGVGIQDLNSDLAENFGVKDVNGVLVNSVKTGSAADRAGIKRGDVIVGVQGGSVSDGNELRNKVANSAPGSELSLTIMRNGSEQKVTAKLDEFVPEKTAFNGTSPNGTNDDKSGAGEKLGLSLQPLTPEIASQLGLKNISGGLVIADVQSGSKAEDAGLQRGDVIMQINRQDVKTVSDAQAALLKSGDKPALLLINRQNQTVYVTV